MGERIRIATELPSSYIVPALFVAVAGLVPARVVKPVTAQQAVPIITGI